MNYRRFGDKYVVRLEKGEELVESIKELAKKEDIMLGRVSGMGAVNRVEVSIYGVETKEYFKKEINEEMEIVSLEGNIARKDGEPILHLHTSVTCEDCRVFGGHLHSADISVTAEIIIDVIDGELTKEFDEETGANLFKFD